VRGPIRYRTGPGSPWTSRTETVSNLSKIVYPSSEFKQPRR
jgi:hypothetical protein